MGSVFRARDVVIKVLRVDSTQRPNALAAYANEARVLSFFLIQASLPFTIAEQRQRATRIM